MDRRDRDSTFATRLHERTWAVAVSGLCRLIHLCHRPGAAMPTGTLRVATIVLTGLVAGGCTDPAPISPPPARNRLHAEGTSIVDTAWTRGRAARRQPRGLVVPRDLDLAIRLRRRRAGPCPGSGNADGGADRRCPDRGRRGNGRRLACPAAGRARSTMRRGRTKALAVSWRCSSDTAGLGRRGP
jgi:hypothetical protein